MDGNWCKCSSEFEHQNHQQIVEWIRRSRGFNSSNKVHECVQQLSFLYISFSILYDVIYLFISIYLRAMKLHVRQHAIIVSVIGVTPHPRLRSLRHVIAWPQPSNSYANFHAYYEIEILHSSIWKKEGNKHLIVKSKWYTNWSSCWAILILNVPQNLFFSGRTHAVFQFRPSGVCRKLWPKWIYCVCAMCVFTLTRRDAFFGCCCLPGVLVE